MGKKHLGLFAAVILFGSLVSAQAPALDLDWSGQFRAESHWIINYTGSNGQVTTDATRAAGGGYYIGSSGESNAFFQTLFLRLRPSLVVNDNIYIKSEWWLGDPIYGIFGSSTPYTSEQRQFNSTQNRGSFIKAQRLWGEFISDFGTVQVGRIPLNWGLGLHWSAGDGPYDRFQSTSDAIRWLIRFGSFAVAPTFAKHSIGNSIGGTCAYNAATGACDSGGSHGNVTDYSFMVLYDNRDEDLQLGLNFIKRTAGSGQDPASGIFGVESTPVGMNYNIWDIYGRKKFGNFTLAGEFPITSGNIGSMGYSTFAAALEFDWAVTRWNAGLKAGLAPGQGNHTTGTTTDKFKAFYFNPNYRTALIMFNYQLNNFAGPQTTNNPNLNESTLSAPFGNSVVNAMYGSIHGGFKLGKWKFHSTWTLAQAMQAATSGSDFYNHWTRQFVSATDNQAKFLGWEMDYGVSLDWDESFRFDFDFGVYFPGQFYTFSNTTTANRTDPIFGTTFKASVSF